MSYYSRPPPNISGMVSLKVDNLTYRTTTDDLKKVFEKYGEVGDVYIPRHPHTKESRGFAFVRFYDNRDAQEAVDALDGYVYDGREMRVQVAKYGPPKEDRSRRGYRSRSRSRSRSHHRRDSRSRSRSRRRHSRSGSRDRDRKRTSKSSSRSNSRNRSQERDSKRRRSQEDQRRSRSRSADDRHKSRRSQSRDH